MNQIQFAVLQKYQNHQKIKIVVKAVQWGISETIKIFYYQVIML